VHSHSKRIFTHIRAKVSGRGACTQRTFHKLYILPKARISASVLHIRRFHAYSRIFTHAPHVHTHTRHLAHIRTEARIFTRKLPQMATFPSLLTQQNDLVKFARKNSQKPSLLEQQFGLGRFHRKSGPNPEPVRTAIWTWSNLHAKTAKSRACSYSKVLGNFSHTQKYTPETEPANTAKVLGALLKKKRTKCDTVNIAKWTWSLSHTTTIETKTRYC